MGFSSFSAASAISLLFALTVHAFTFSVNSTAPDSCTNATVEWSGGTAPYSLLVTPSLNVPYNYSIPSSAFTNGQGSYSFQIPFSAGTEFVLTMSDATGFGSGGNSQILTVGNSSSGSCNTTGPGVDFTFQANSALTQCRTFTFSAYTGAVQPITILGIIPGGDSFTLSPPSGSSSFDWTADVYNGTHLLFVVIDSEGRQGGSSTDMTVLASGDNSCINSTSPSSTEAPFPSATTSSGSSSTSDSSSSSGSTTSTGAIVGAVVGGLIFIAAVISLAFFCLRRRKERKDPQWIEASGAFARGPRRNHSVDIDLLGGDSHAAGLQPYADNQASYPNTASTRAPSQFSSFANQSTHPSQSAQFLPSEQAEITPFTAQSEELSSFSSSTRKGSGPYNRAAPRFILHHDAEDVVEQEEDEVVELPPQYTERRAAPGEGSSSMSGPSMSGPSSMPFGDRKDRREFEH